MYRVLLVDDEEIDLEGMRRLIDWRGLGMEVVAAVSSGLAAMQVIENEAVDVLVTDIRMPGMSGLELVRLAAQRQPELESLFVSGYEDFHYARQAIRMQASGYVLKPVDDDELHQVLTDVKAKLDRASPGPGGGSGRSPTVGFPEGSAISSVKKNRRLVEEIARYVREHLQRNFTLREVADHFSFSPNHLGYLFKEATGMNFSDYVIQARLQCAAELLRDPRIKVYEAANQAGYRNLAYFSKQFRECYGMTPGEYRGQC